MLKQCTKLIQRCTISPSIKRCGHSYLSLSCQRRQHSTSSRINLIENDQIIELVWQSNKANFLNVASLNELLSMLDEIDHPNNKSKYDEKPIILTTDSNTIFSSGMDLNAYLNFANSNDSISNPNEANPSSLSAHADTGTSEMVEIYSAFETVLHRLCFLNHRTVAEIKGHAMAGGFFIGLACDARIGWYNYNYHHYNGGSTGHVTKDIDHASININKGKIGVNVIDIGATLPSLPYLLIQHKLGTNINWQMIISQPSKMYSHQYAFDKLGYLNRLAMADNNDDFVQEIRKVTIEEALRVKKDSMNAYLSVKQYQLRQLKETYNEEKESAFKEFIRVLKTPQAKRRAKDVVKRLQSRK